MKTGNDRRAKHNRKSHRRGAGKRPLLLECLESRVLLSATALYGDHSNAGNPLLTISPVTVTEGDATAYATVTATLNGPHAETVHYATVNGTAKSGINFTATSGTLTMTPGSSSTFTIPILPNDISQGTTTFKVNLSIGSSVTQGKVTILDNDALPTVSASDTSVNAGTKSQTVSIPVTLSNPSSKAVKITYMTQDVTAVKGKDYQQAKGTLTIPAGSTTAIIKVQVLKDAATDTDKAFDVVLSSATNATLTSVAGGTDYARVAILNTVGTNIVRPTLAVSDATAIAGDEATFNVTLSQATTQTVSVRYHTEPGTATTADYTPVDGILTIPAGSTTGTITVQTGSIGSLASAAFTLALSAPANAALAGTTVTGTILGTLPTVGVSNASVTKQDSGTSTLAFTVTLSSAEPFPVTVNYATSDGTAIAGTDYTGANGTLTFTPGQTSQTVDVTVDGNTNIQLDKTMDLTLSDAANATLATATGVGTIVNNDFPTIAIGSAAVAEIGGDTTTQTMTFTVTLSSAAPFPVTVNYATSDGTAIAGTDYNAANGTLTFTPGQTSQTLTVTVTGDSVAPGETFDVNLSSAANATVSAGAGVGTIYYAEAGTDLADNLSASSGAYYPVTTNLARAESFTTGSSMMSVTSITLSLQMYQPGSPTLMIYSDNSGSPGSLVGTLTSPGSFSSSGYANATFTTNGILLNADSTYWVVLQSTGEMDWNASASTGTGSGFTGISKVPSGSVWQLDVGNPPLMQVMAATVTNGPGISIAPASVTENGSDITNETMAYTVTLDNPAPFPVTVNYATSDGTAIAGTDYTAASGTLTIPAGQTSGTINVTVTGDSVAPGETFNLTLSSATNATISTALGVGTINYEVGADLSDNLSLSPSSSSVILFNGSQWIAASFATGSSSADSMAVTLFAELNSGDTPTAMIYSDSGGHPGSLVGTLTTPASYSTSWGMTTFSGEGFTLDAGTTYWVVMKGNGSNFLLGWGLSSSGSGSGVGFTGSQALYSQNSGSSWAGEGDYAIMQVTTESDTNGPLISIAPTSVTEIVGDGTTPTMTYTVTLDNPAPFPVTVHYATSDGTAAAGTDYTAANGTLTFAPGETSKTISVTVTGDSTAADETLNVNLSAATNATIATATGVGTITYGGTDLSDNLAAPSDGNIGVTSSQWVAAGFTTGSSSVTLAAVTIPLEMSSPGSVTMAIYSNSAGAPGSLVGTLTAPGSYASDTPTNATFTTSGIALDANTTYWVVVSSSGYFGWDTTVSSSGTGSGFTGQGLVSDNSGSSWSSFNGFMMQVVAS